MNTVRPRSPASRRHASDYGGRRTSAARWSAVATIATATVLLTGCGSAQLSPSEAAQQSSSPEQPTPTATATATATSLPEPSEILAAFGAQGSEGVTSAQVSEYERVHGFIDSNGDGRVTVQEYIASGHFPEDTARAIHGGQDFDDDGTVSIEEYVEHRTHTDEAKTVHGTIDADANGIVTEQELVDSGALSESQSRALFAALDADSSGGVDVPEWLSGWGTWVWGEWIGPQAK